MTGASADAVFIAERVEPMAPGQPRGCTVVAVRAGAVLAVGGEDLVRAVRGRGTRVERFPGATITPGLIDAHSHPLLGVRRARGLDLGAITGLGELKEALVTAASALGADEWVLGWNLGYDLFRGSPISSAPFEEALGRRPMLLLFFDGHTGLATERALRLTERALPGADSGVFVVDHDGLLTGEVREESAIAAVLAAAPALTDAEIAERAGEVLQQMAAAGWTGACLMDGDASSVSLLERLEDVGDLPLRLVGALQHDPEFGPDRLQDHLRLTQRHGRRWRGGLIKLYADGVIDTGTGWLAEPDSQQEGTQGWWADPDGYRRTVHAYAEAGLQVATHAIGDAAIGAVLDAYAGARPAAPGRGPHRVEHLELLADEDVRRLRQIGAVASMQPSHMQWRRADGTDSWGSRVGPERTARAWRTGDLVRAGVELALGSDWPVAGFDPREIMAWARLRRPPGQPGAPVLEPDQALTGEQALAGLTSSAARAQGDLHLGALAPGSAADMTVWGEDPVRVGGDDLVSVPVLATFVGGAATHRAEH